MIQPTDGPRFRVRCHTCGRTILSGIARVGDAEAAELRAHLGRCRPDVAVPADFGRLLARFDVASTRDGA